MKMDKEFCIKIKNEKKSRKIQKLLFENGYAWRDSGNKYWNLNDSCFNYPITVLIKNNKTLLVGISKEPDYKVYKYKKLKKYLEGQNNG